MLGVLLGFLVCLGADLVCLDVVLCDGLFRGVLLCCDVVAWVLLHVELG